MSTSPVIVYFVIESHKRTVIWVVKISPFYSYGKLRLIIEVRTHSDLPLLTLFHAGPFQAWLGTSCVFALSFIIFHSTAFISGGALSHSLSAGHISICSHIQSPE